jgi:hypothetical protein
MLKALLAGAAVTLAIAAGPALAQKSPGSPMSMGPMAQPPIGQPPAMQQTPILQPPIQQQVVPDEPVTPADRAAVRRDWNEMAREWQQRQRSGGAGTGSSMGAPTPGLGGTAYGSVDTHIMPSQPSARTTIPMRGTGMQGTSDVPMSPAERAQARRDWNDVSREWQLRQRAGGVASPGDPGQPPLPYQR